MVGEQKINNSFSPETERTELLARVNTLMGKMFHMKYNSGISDVLTTAAQSVRLYERSGVLNFDLEAIRAEAIVTAVGTLLADPEAPVSEIRDYFVNTAQARNAALNVVGEFEASRRYARGLRQLGIGVEEAQGEEPDAYHLASDLALSLDIYLNHRETLPPVIDTFMRMVDNLEGTNTYYPDPFEPVDYFPALAAMREAQKESRKILAIRSNKGISAHDKEILRKHAGVRQEALASMSRHGEAYFYSLAAVSEEQLHRTSW